MNGSFGPLTLAHQRDHRLSCLFGWPMSGVLLVVKSWWSNCWTIKLSASGPFVWSQLDWPFCRPFYVLMPVVHLVVSSWWFSWWPIFYTLRSWSWQAIWWAKFSCPFGGPKLVVNSVDSQVIKWMGHLVCQSWIPLVIKSWWSIWQSIWTSSWWAIFSKVVVLLVVWRWWAMWYTKISCHMVHKNNHNLGTTKRTVNFD